MWAVVERELGSLAQGVCAFLSETMLFVCLTLESRRKNLKHLLTCRSKNKTLLSFSPTAVCHSNFLNETSKNQKPEFKIHS